MCTYSQNITLAKTSNAQVNWCKGCRSYSVIYKCCCLSFTHSELVEFSQLLCDLREEDFSYDFVGDQYTLIKNHFAYMGVCLTRADVRSLNCLIQEAVTMYDVFKIIYD